METAPLRPRPTKVRQVGRMLLLLGAATTAVALFAPWQDRGSIDEARFCQCYSTSMHASQPVIALFLAIAAGSLVLAALAGRRILPCLSYGAVLVPIVLGFAYFVAYASTGAGDPSIEAQVRWGVVALAAGVILVAAGFVLVALTGASGGSERQHRALAVRSSASSAPSR